MSWSFKQGDRVYAWKDCRETTAPASMQDLKEVRGTDLRSMAPSVPAID